MQFLLSLLSAGVVVPLLVFYGQAHSVQGLVKVPENTDVNLEKGTNEGEVHLALKSGVANTEGTISGGGEIEEDILDDPDFRDDEDGLVNLDEDISNVNSLTHFHRNNGEILIPCFGMWWPAGGGGGYGGGAYYYTSDGDYGDYRRKRRRSRKRNRAAKNKKKKA